MAYEIELKAWVDDWDAVEDRLQSSCNFIREFRKSDTYFRSQTGSEKDTSFRLRRDGDSAIVTFKDKRPVEGIEYNREREFTVDDADAFLELVARAGCVEYATKIKSGLEFRRDRMTVELVRVDGLGSFLEIEIIEAPPDAAIHQQAAATIRSFLREIGLSEDRIEGESYITLIRGNQVSDDSPGAG